MDSLHALAHSAVEEADQSASTERFLDYFAENHQRILAYIFSLLPNEQDANDVFQKTSLVLWRKFDQFDEEGDFLAWACGVAYYEVRNFLRVAGRDRLRFNDDLLRTLADERELRHQRSEQRSRALAECVGKLRRAERELIRQAYSGDRTIKQLAEEIGRATQTVYNRLNRIRRRLVDCVQYRLGEGTRVT